MKRRITNIVQGLLWLAGHSVHNKIANECCPDFSCCMPRLKDKSVKSRARTLYRAWIRSWARRPLWFRLFHPNVSQTRLCSGFRVFPSGEHCPGCLDCHNLGGML